MSKVSDVLIEMTEAVIESYNLSQEDFDQVQTIILDCELPLDKLSVLNYFHAHIICPHCLSLQGLKCACNQLDRL